MDIRHLNLQGSTVHQQTIGDNATATQTNTYAIPAEHQAAIDETTRKVQAEMEKPEPSIQTILDDIMALAWKNKTAFLCLVKAWFSK